MRLISEVRILLSVTILQKLFLMPAKTPGNGPPWDVNKSKTTGPTLETSKEMK